MRVTDEPTVRLSPAFWVMLTLAGFGFLFLPRFRTGSALAERFTLGWPFPTVELSIVPASAGAASPFSPNFDPTWMVNLILWAVVLAVVCFLAVKLSRWSQYVGLGIILLFCVSAFLFLLGAVRVLSFAFLHS